MRAGILVVPLYQVCWVSTVGSIAELVSLRLVTLLEGLVSACLVQLWHYFLLHNFTSGISLCTISIFNSGIGRHMSKHFISGISPSMLTKYSSFIKLCAIKFCN